MTNAQIIMGESLRLMEEGILKGSGEFVTVEDADGEMEVELPEAIHTYARWKKLGFQVKKGEKAIAQFHIWKATKKNETMADKDGNEITEEVMKMFMKKASFFSASQVEKIAEVA